MAVEGTPIKLPPIDYRALRDGPHEAAMRKLEAKSAALPEDVIKGRLIRFQVYDGYAHYQVSKLRPLTLRHIDYCDGYAIPGPYLRGLTLADVKNMVAREVMFSRLTRK
jgi:hypothetical protein